MHLPHKNEDIVHLCSTTPLTLSFSMLSHLSRKLKVFNLGHGNSLDTKTAKRRIPLKKHIKNKMGDIGFN